ncbi:MAG: M3 family metallopeptidase [Reichenbachiella sp.]|uniref:M3 family metallopeptidase n=1 Tax=Reichenbachiella sp. TaxID=2184521 RepID=UPI00326794EA
MRNVLSVLVLGLIVISGCQAPEPTTQMNSNPLLTEWDTRFGVPPFDLIKDEHYMPAFEQGMSDNKAEIDAIVNNTEAPTFANTMEALERSGELLNQTSRIFYAVAGAHTNDVLDSLRTVLSPLTSKHYDYINLNKGLFKRVEAIYNGLESSDLNAQQKRLVSEAYKGFVRSGVGLEGAEKERLKEINGRLSELTTKFGQNVLAETNSMEVHTTNPEDYGTLTSSLVALAAEEAKKRRHEEGWSFTLQRPSINPFLQYSPNREMREKLFQGYAMRADNDNENDNKAIIEEIVALRIERANLLGYKTHADVRLSSSVAQTPKAVFDFMDKVWPAALNLAKAERGALTAEMKKDGVEGELKGSDWRYYVEKVRKAKYNFDEDAMRPYFEFTAVRDGAFALAKKLFNVEVRELQDMPKWHEDQQVFEVLEADGTHIGILYMDFFARESKRGGAWMNALRSQSTMDGKVTPVVTNNFNFPAPTADGPSLLSFSESETLFHEFGHALHGLFSNVTYPSQAGTSVPRDFVEFPSQVMENWMSEPEVLKLYAKHYQTGELIPDELIQKMNEANAFNEGFRTVEYMAAAYLDMSWHTLTDAEGIDARAFEKEAMQKIGLIDQIIPRYRSGYFNHIFAGGYSAGYYSYLWSELLDADCFQAFKETGDLFDQETAARYRTMLSKGGSEPGMDLYVEFRGKTPEIGPLLEKKGFQ